MVINIRGPVTSERLADDAVTSAKIADSAITTTKIANDAVITAKFANFAVTTGKLADNAVTSAKAYDGLKQKPLAGDESEIAITGITATDAKELRISVKPDKNIVPDKLLFLVELKSTATHTATAEFYLDGEATPSATASTGATTYTLTSAEIITGPTGKNLSEGTHTVTMKLKSSDAAGVATNRLLDIYQIIL